MPTNLQISVQVVQMDKMKLSRRMTTTERLAISNPKKKDTQQKTAQQLY